MPKRHLIVCITFLLLILITAGHAQVAPDAADAGKKSGDKILESELLSAVGAPCVISGVSVNPSPLWVKTATPEMQTNPVNAEIAWPASIPANCKPTTCTCIFSSAPPGPVQVGLGPSDTAATSGYVYVDSTSIVIDSTRYPNWFPLNPGGTQTDVTSFQYVFLQAQAGWWTATTNPEPKTVGGYPVLQWAPNSVTLIFQ